ncbi:MAG: carboxymuconolactone decarboxylase family protein [Desulfobacterales bacterium]|nr:carboxymuconolactone decarboxylase family protein [Desulfobacterales bacterium]
MSRIPSITTENFNNAQKQLCDRITGGKRSQGRSLDSFFTKEGGLRGPFNAFLYNPVIGEAAQRLGEVLRFEGALSGPLRELAILTAAAKWEAHYEWWAHEKIGRKQGLDDRVIKSLKAGEEPEFGDPAQRLVFAFCRELLVTGHISDRPYAKAVDLLGEAGVVELVFLLGYYTTIAMVLNVFEIPLPEGEQVPF